MSTKREPSLASSDQKKLKGSTPNDREAECFETAMAAVIAASKSIGIMADRDMILSASRHPKIVMLRHALLYVLREVMGVRTTVASKQAKINHSTLLYGAKQLLQRASVEPEVATLLRATMQELDMPVPQYIMMAAEKKIDPTVYKYQDRGLESWRKR